MHRRQFLQATVLTGAAITGSGSAAAATDHADSIDIRHSPVWSTIDGEGVNSEHLTVGTVDDELFEFGGSADRSLRIVDAETGGTLSFEPSADEQTYATDHLTIFTGRSGNAPAGDDWMEGVDVRTRERADNSARLTGTYSGDTELFTHRTFAPYIVELLDGNGNVIAATDEKVYGINYEWEFEQRGATATITRDPGVDDDWLVEFEVENDSVSDTQVVSHEPGDDVFEIALDELRVPEGEYEWSLRIFAGPYAERETLAIRLWGSDEQPVVIDDFSDGSTDESDEESDSDDDGSESDGSEDAESEDDGSESDTEEDTASEGDGTPAIGPIATVGSIAGGYALNRYRSDGD